MKKRNEIKNFISNILLIGVLMSSFFIFFGIIISIFKKDIYINYSDINIRSIILGLIKFNSYSYLMFGILLLIFTPIIRVLGMLLEFIIEKNKIYILISILVLIILFISLILGVNH